MPWPARTTSHRTTGSGRVAASKVGHEAEKNARNACAIVFQSERVRQLPVVAPARESDEKRGCSPPSNSRGEGGGRTVMLGPRR